MVNIKREKNRTMKDTTMIAAWLRSNKVTVVAPAIASLDREARPADTFKRRVALATNAVPTGSRLSSNR